MRKGTVIVWLGLLFMAVIALFWQNEWVYNLPTPVPKDYQAVSTGKKIDLTPTVKSATGKPVFLHFFNPDCPCSRFNMKHFKSLVKEYGNKADFTMVVLTNKNYSASAIQEKFNIHIPVLFDSTLAASCGVYSTPQAVIIDANQALYFRGNYNRTRYCADKKTEYARIALNTLLEKGPVAHFDQYALKAYGCTLPTCK